MIFILAILIVIGLVSFELFYNRRLKECAKRLPGLPLLPIFGNAHQLGKNPVENLKVALKLGSFGNMTRLLIGPYLFVTLTGPAEIEFVATNTKLNDKSNDYQFLQSWLGDGLLLSGGDKWRKRRKLITPSFHFNILRQYISIFEKEADIMVKKFEDAPAVFDVYPLVTLCTLDVIGETAMGVKLNSQSNPTSEYVTAVTEASLVVFKRLTNLLARFEMLFKLTPTYRKYQQHLKILHNFTNRIIKERREVLEKKNVKGEPFDVNDECIGIKKRFSFLDTLLLSETSDGSKLSDEDIREEVDTFMFEGHDTTASAISFLLYSLAQNKDVQEKVYQEQVDIFGDDFERDITYEDLNNMKYAEMTIKECLRLYPSVPLIMRKVSRDLNLNGTDIPAGAQLTLNIFAMNRKPEVFEDPLNFNPERFSQENISKRHPFSYIPFSAGARNCIGQRFAMLQIKTVLSKCVRKFVLSLGNNEPLQVGSALVLKSYNGIHLSVKKRQ